MNFFSLDKCKGYKKLLVSSLSMSGVGKILMQEEYEDAHKGDMDLYKIVKLGELNRLTCKELLPLYVNFSVGKVSFELVRHAKSLEFPEGNYKVAWDSLVNLHTALSQLKLKSEF